MSVPVILSDSQDRVGVECDGMKNIVLNIRCVILEFTDAEDPRSITEVLALMALDFMSCPILSSIFGRDRGQISNEEKAYQIAHEAAGNKFGIEWARKRRYAEYGAGAPIRYTPSGMIAPTTAGAR